MQTLPYIFNDKDKKTSFNRILVKPTEIPETISESGLIVPKHESKLCEMGKVYSVCEGSSIPVGAEVLYQKIDRLGEEHLDTVTIDDEVYDLLYEHEMWCVNEEPWNQIFVIPVTDTGVTDSGLLITQDTKGFTQKGIVHLSPEKYGLKAGDTVEYRRQEVGLYPQVNLDGQVMDVLFERDIFLINDKAAPYRMIVKVDLHAQHIKRNTADSGILLSPLFIAMLHNLQFAEVVSIGKEAQKMYPQLHAHDTVIMHHCIESQNYRTVKYDTGKEGGATYAYYIVNCWEEKSREIFAKMHYEKNTGKIIDITPLNGNVFLKWNFNVLSGRAETSELLPADTDITIYHTLDDMRNAIDQQKKIAAEKAKLKTAGIKMAISQANPDINKDRWDMLNSEFAVMKKEETRVAQYLRKDHLVVCRTAYPKMDPAYVITPYEELYPINILGQKFLIAIPDFLIAKTHTDNMNIKAQDILPLGDNALILPIEEEQKEGALIRPDSAKEKPIKGKVIAIDNHPTVKTGDVVLFRKQAGLEQEVEGVVHLILKHNDLLAIVTPAI